MQQGEQGDAPSAQPVGNDNQLDVKQMMDAYGAGTGRNHYPATTRRNHLWFTRFATSWTTRADAWEADGGQGDQLLKRQDAFEVEEQIVDEQDVINQTE